MKIMKLLAALLVAACAQDTPEHWEDTVGKEIADSYNEQMNRARDVEIELQDKMERVEDALAESDP